MGWASLRSYKGGFGARASRPSASGGNDEAGFPGVHGGACGFCRYGGARQGRADRHLCARQRAAGGAGARPSRAEGGDEPALPRRVDERTRGTLGLCASVRTSDVFRHAGLAERVRRACCTRQRDQCVDHRGRHGLLCRRAVVVAADDPVAGGRPHGQSRPFGDAGQARFAALGGQERDAPERARQGRRLRLGSLLVRPVPEAASL